MLLLSLLASLVAAPEQFESDWWFWEESPPVSNEMVQYDFSDVEAKLSSAIFGQEAAVRLTSDILISYQAGIRDPQKPIGCLLYIGPTGVGKTELAKEIARLIFGTEERLIRLNLSEYSDAVGLNRLIGIPRGYVDSDQGGILSNALLAQPRSVLLLDELEKAHPVVRALFLHIFDEGVFESGRGKTVNCRDCLIIATTNLGADKILSVSDSIPHDDLLYALENDLTTVLSPELYNRLTPVIFRGLNRTTLQKIVQSQLKRLSDRVEKAKQVYLQYAPSVADYLAHHGYHPKLGARPLARLMKQQLEAPLARLLIQHPPPPNSTLLITLNKTGQLLSEQLP